MQNALQTLSTLAAATGLYVGCVFASLASTAAISAHLSAADCRAEAAMARIAPDHCGAR
jgi:hypothetical protein